MKNKTLGRIFHGSKHLTTILQRIYNLPKDANSRYQLFLKESVRKHTPVLVWRVSKASDVITVVEKVRGR